MIPKILTPPEHRSAGIAFDALNPLRGFIDSALPKIATGLTAHTSRQLFTQFARIAQNLQESYESGILDGSAEWKGKVGAALADIAAINAVAAPIQQKYANQVGQKIAETVDAVLSTEEAGALVEFDQADIDSIVAAISSVLEK